MASLRTVAGELSALGTLALSARRITPTAARRGSSPSSRPRTASCRCHAARAAVRLRREESPECAEIPGN